MIRAVSVRWLKFNAVGGIGIGVQLAVLAGFTGVLRWDYLLSTALAVEAAVIHNYLWHERFTWADRPAKQRLARFAKFNLTTGVLSIAGNLALMKLFVEAAHVNYFLANLLAIATCSILNFVVSERFVFQTGR